MNSDKDLPEGFQRICSINELQETVGRRFIINNTEIAVFLLNRKIFVLSNICPHQHSPLIYDGFIEDEFVVCPAHGWKFNLKSGNTPIGSRGLDTYETKVIDGSVYAKVIEKKFSW
jgi:nitrite reductase/ring-hydroxylating ferredoxin subunit